MEYTIDDVALHSTDGNRWLIFGGDVYDVSHFKHPGGAAALEKHGGKDATAAMFGVAAHKEHIEGVQKYLEKCKIGTVKK
jgi:cytochrome b involved in lipid metabolism